MFSWIATTRPSGGWCRQVSTVDGQNMLLDVLDLGRAGGGDALLVEWLVAADALVVCSLFSQPGTTDALTALYDKCCHAARLVGGRQGK
jgi:hypothetical protein